MAGKLNGVGGKVEFHETARGAMLREFREETGVDTYGLKWREFGLMEGPGYCTYCYSLTDQDSFEEAKTEEKEQVVKIAVNELQEDQCVAALRRLIELALDESSGHTVLQADQFGVVGW